MADTEYKLVTPKTNCS